MNWISFCLLIFVLFGCKENSSFSNSNSKDIDYQQLGTDIVLQSQSAILSKLSIAIQEQGLKGALEYCSANVSNIIDSLSKVHQCKIRRTSLKLRNTANSPRNDDEIMILQQFRENYLQNKVTEGRLVERDGKPVFYKPIIVMMNTCLKCHGKPKIDISSEVENKILELYPNDQAMNYELNDFRGMWVIEFEK